MDIENPPGDVPGDVLLGLIAVNKNLVAPEVISAALRARALEPKRTLAEQLVSQGDLTPAQRDLVETLCGECIERGGGDALKGLATLITTVSLRERLDQPAGPAMSESLNAAEALETTFPDEPDLNFDHPERTLPPKTDDAVGARPRVAGYEILELLGSGGMGIVYKARQERLDRLVALKMIRAGAVRGPKISFASRQKRRRLPRLNTTTSSRSLTSANRTASPISRSNIFLAVASPRGSAASLSQSMRPPGSSRVLANAMHVAHQHKVIHRDLKPANVLLAADGTLKITDFGLVKRLESDSGQTRSGSILGTPSYMAPEQARGESQTVGPAADQYSLGAILYELLTGRPPFQGTSVIETLDMVRNNEPVAPSQLQPKTPRDLETICLKCLEKDIARRYPDVLALAEDLRRFRAGETILARPVSDAERFWRWCKRNRRVASLSAAVVLLLLIVAAASAIAAVTLRRANAVAEEKRREAERYLAVARGQRREPKRGGSGCRADSSCSRERYVTCRRSRVCESRRSTRRSCDSRPRPRR